MCTAPFQSLFFFLVIVINRFVWAILHSNKKLFCPHLCFFNAKLLEVMQKTHKLTPLVPPPLLLLPLWRGPTRAF